MKKEVVTEKLQKTLARAGYGSRRELERWIAAGRVRVNGARATVGMRVSSHDVIQVDGQRNACACCVITKPSERFAAGAETLIGLPCSIVYRR
jgi:16S rRNA U516 pseudouridylate synthase RsuA-like enzyme